MLCNLHGGYGRVMNSHGPRHGHGHGQGSGMVTMVSHRITRVREQSRVESSERKSVCDQDAIHTGLSYLPTYPDASIPSNSRSLVVHVDRPVWDCVYDRPATITPPPPLPSTCMLGARNETCVQSPGPLWRRLARPGRHSLNNPCPSEAWVCGRAIK